MRLRPWWAAALVLAACTGSPSSQGTGPSGGDSAPASAAPGSATPGPASPPSTCPPAAAVPHPPPPPVTAAGDVRLDGSPVGLAAADGAIWVALAPLNRVARIDTASGTVKSTVDGSVEVADTPLRLAAAGGGVWVSEFRNGTVARIDPASMRVVCRVAVGQEPEGLAGDDRSLWVVLQRDRRLVELDPATGAVRRRIDLPGADQPRAAAVDGGTVWVSDYAAGLLLPVDARTGRVGPPARPCAHPQGLAPASGRIWVACIDPGRLVGVLPAAADGKRIELPLPHDPDGVTADGTRVVVALSDGPAVVGYDTRTSELGGVTTLGTSGRLRDANVDVLVAAGQVWVGSWNEQLLRHRPVAALR